MKIVSSNQFLTAVLAALVIEDGEQYFFIDMDLDAKFEAAFLKLEACGDARGLVCDFSFRRDPYHGDSSCFRDTLYEIGSWGLIEICGTTYRSFSIAISKDKAVSILQGSPVPEELLKEIAVEIFNAHRGNLSRAV